MKHIHALVPNITSILVGVIVALIVFGIGTQLSASTIRANEIESANNTLSSLISRINTLESGQKNTFGIQGVNKKGWILTGWSGNDPLRPNKCFFASCVCVCQTKITTIAEVRKQCQEKSLCDFIEEDTLVFLSRTYTPSDGINPELKSVAKVISLPQNFIELTLEKKDNSLHITHFTQEYKDRFPEDYLAQKNNEIQKEEPTPQKEETPPTIPTNPLRGDQFLIE